MKAPLIGRQEQLDAVESAIERAEDGNGSLLLVEGEAGVGKTRLLEVACSEHRGPVLRGSATSGGTSPYAPVVEALRSHLRTEPDALAGCGGSLRAHLALLLPELGEAAADSDRQTIFEAIRCALGELASEGAAILVLDDLHWSDETTLELLAALAPALDEMPVLALAAYRSDGLSRDHRLRWLRNEMRRGGRLEEITLNPLDKEGSKALLRELLSDDPSPALTAAVNDRTMGSPFFIEELVGALQKRGGLRNGKRGLELADEEIPVPDTVREAVLVGISDYTLEAHEAAEVAAIAGQQLDLNLVAALAPPNGLGELLGSGLLVETERGRAAFRHALTREALYAEVPWMRRRELHAELAAMIEKAGGHDAELATHWLGAGNTSRARDALVRAAADSESLAAHRDASQAARRALELWPTDEDGSRWLETVERCARCAELAGDFGEAATAWREVGASCNRKGDTLGFARAQRRLAAVHELRGERDAAFSSRQLAADTFAAAGERADASLERLAMADHHRRGGRFRDAVELAEAAADDARAAERVDIEARALGLRGVAEAKGGDYESGLESVRSGLTIALEHDHTAAAAELYQRLSLVLYDSADYRSAEQALDTALTLCRRDGSADTEVACVTCLVYVLRERGDWRQATELGRELIDADTATWVAEGLVGAVHAFQGKLSSARRMLTSSRSVSAAVGHYNMYVDSTTALAQVAAGEGAHEEAVHRCDELLTRWRESDDHHYAVWGVRWATAYLAD
jgi:tetratricopeptide (TPR) repeat protein